MERSIHLPIDNNFVNPILQKNKITSPNPSLLCFFFNSFSSNFEQIFDLTNISSKLVFETYFR